MSKWINYRMDGRTEASPFINYPKHLGGKGRITNSLEDYTLSKYKYLGGSRLKPLNHNGSYGSIRIMPLQPTPEWNRTRTRGLFYN